MCQYVRNWVQVLPEARGIRYPWSWYCRQLSATWCGCWELNRGLLEEQKVLLIGKPSLKGWQFNPVVVVSGPPLTGIWRKQQTRLPISICFGTACLLDVPLGEEKHSVLMICIIQCFCFSHFPFFKLFSLGIYYAIFRKTWPPSKSEPQKNKYHPPPLHSMFWILTQCPRDGSSQESRFPSHWVGVHPYCIEACSLHAWKEHYVNISPPFSFLHHSSLTLL